jgi:hypothetical protein
MVFGKFHGRFSLDGRTGWSLVYAKFLGTETAERLPKLP